MLRELWRRRQELLREVKTTPVSGNASAELRTYMKQTRSQLEAISSLFGLIPDRDDEAEQWQGQAERGEAPGGGLPRVAALKTSPRMRAHLDRLTKKGRPGG